MPISSFFSSGEHAQAAIAALKRNGFRPSLIRVVDNAGGPVAAETLRTKGVPVARAPAYAARINAGDTLLIVEAPFGSAAIATRILQRAPGADAPPPPVTHEPYEEDNAAPLSTAFGLPILSSDPIPFSRFWNMPVLSSPHAPEKSFGMKLLSDDPVPLSSAIGMPVLSAKAAPLSSALGLKVLAARAAPLSAMLGLKVISDNAAPFSAALGLKVLSHDPAPLSRLLGLKVLSDKQ
jgi:hypothetical protein